MERYAAGKMGGLPKKIKKRSDGSEQQENRFVLVTGRDFESAMSCTAGTGF